MPQQVRGVLGTIDDLFKQVDSARRARDLTWDELASGLQVSRQYLVRQVQAESVPLGLLDGLMRKLNLRPRVRVARSIRLLLQPQT